MLSISADFERLRQFSTTPSSLLGKVPPSCRPLVDVRPITESLDDLMEDVPNTDDVLVITEHRNIINKTAVTLQGAKSYFEVFTKVNISNSEPIINKINYYIKTLASLNKDHAASHVRIINVLQKLDGVQQDKYINLTNSLKMVIPILGLQIQVIGVLERLLIAFNNKDNIMIKSLIVELIATLNEFSIVNPPLLVWPQVCEKIVDIQEQMSQDDVTLNTVMSLVLAMLQFSIHTIDVVKKHMNL
ncbi:hypothetical protein SAMD00019534_015230 [Acytostelium subglobosum LB1]|uniref:hypothetical protein n=1 Tax=Acytostelium subglobosum LB1 TaxID=1410327 RepID=UPI00064480A5|nr:hypothetical protein SAMD00019534_015230 [Acytostelium subglobosum LB1]GAM18348.1 hypothetical protein SAMD00019534_015230 [Acytostelium subglobosum LB1]|eukprot:XP_012757568.1 hypothetical protein SAMD00019534_015230 [Acytostelium subglobosum LB1]